MSLQKIAIYSAEIPSTTFVERLVEGLADSGKKVFLFGALKKRKNYNNNVVIVAYGNRFQKAFQLFYYTLLLMLFKRNDKKKLDDILLQQGNSTFFARVKYYPVLFYHPQIFHLQWAKSIGDWMWVKEFGIKLVLSLRGTHITISPIGNKYLEDLYKELFPKIDGFHAVSNAIGSIAQNYGADDSKIKTVYSGLDIEKLSFVLKEKRNTPLKIISIGRAHWVKGYNYALDAFSVLEKQEFDFEYSIIGISIEEELIVQRSHRDLEKRIHFVSQKPFHEVLSAIREADVLLLPSVEEGIANVVLEAMALGVLVISTDCGGMNEVINDGENGFLIPVRDPQAIAEAIYKASSLSISDYQKITLAARKTIEVQHSFHKMVSDMNTLYETIINEYSCE